MGSYYARGRDKVFPVTAPSFALWSPEGGWAVENEARRSIIETNVSQTNMDWSFHAARWVLGRIPGEELPDIAVQALLEGEETPTLARLAGEVRPTLVDAGWMFESVLRELGIELPDPSAAMMTLARNIARRVLSGELPPVAGAVELDLLALDLPEPPEALRNFGALESEISDFGDDVRLSYYGAEYCAEVRRRCEAEIVAACRSLVEA